MESTYLKDGAPPSLTRILILVILFTGGGLSANALKPVLFPEAMSSQQVPITELFSTSSLSNQGDWNAQLQQCGDHNGQGFSSSISHQQAEALCVEEIIARYLSLEKRPAD